MATPTNRLTEHYDTLYALAGWRHPLARELWARYHTVVLGSRLLELWRGQPSQVELAQAIDQHQAKFQEALLRMERALLAAVDPASPYRTERVCVGCEALFGTTGPEDECPECVRRAQEFEHGVEPDEDTLGGRDR